MSFEACDFISVIDTSLNFNPISKGLNTDIATIA